MQLHSMPCRHILSSKVLHFFLVYFVLTFSVLSYFAYYLENAKFLISRGLLLLRPCLKTFASNDVEVLSGLHFSNQ